MEGGPLLKEEYVVEPLPGDVAIAKFIQVTLSINRESRGGKSHPEKPAGPTWVGVGHGFVRLPALVTCISATFSYPHDIMTLWMF